MTKQNANAFRYGLRLAAAVILPLLLADCASAPRNARDIPPPAPTSYFTVPVRSGDTVSELAARYQVSEDDVLALNNIYDRNALPSGGKARIPAYGHLRDPRREIARAPSPYDRNDSAPLYAPPRAAPYTAVTTSELDAPTASSNRYASNDVPTPRRKPAEPAQQQPAQASPSWFDGWFPSTTNETPSRRFLWPVTGHVISSFGATGSGERNDGINISAARGAPVRAADAGTVTYVGNELKGYGNLVLIRHDNGYVTAYAHNERISVQRGDRVARGQIIALAGETGDVTQPQVHFEIRVGTKPVDPRPYLVAAN